MRTPLLVLALLISLGACRPDAGTRSEATDATATTASVAADSAADQPTPAPAAAFTIRHPAWAAHATIYEVNVRQYTPEGTFRAFEKHLPRLERMGVGILWLMPVHPIGERKRKGALGSAYSVRDYRAVNPDLGTLADLQHLTAEAHRRGMHVILDWVANHTAWDNPLLTQHPDWYTHGPDGRVVPPVKDWEDVIDLDYTKPALRAYMTESMAYWVREADIDGFRCDVAGLVPTDFWDATRARLEQLKPVFMLAEWDELHHPPFIGREFTPNTHLLERAFDATYALRLHYRLDTLARGKLTWATVPTYLALERRAYPPNVSLMNFTSSHDVNSWDGSEYERYAPDTAKVRQLAALSILLPGIPMVYSGQESALRKRLRFFDEDTIPWGTYPLLPFYTKLLNLKKTHPALAAGDAASVLQLLPLTGAPGRAFAFTRRKGAAAVLFAASDASDAAIRLSAAEAGSWRDVLTGRAVTLRAGETFQPGRLAVLMRP